jgi:hypothetical protein
MCSDYTTPERMEICSTIKKRLKCMMRFERKGYIISKFGLFGIIRFEIVDFKLIPLIGFQWRSPPFMQNKLLKKRFAFPR